jgi:DNA-binding NtrC family response regulator
MHQIEQKILIIDPDINGRKELADYLVQKKYKVETGEGLADAVKKLAKDHFPCIIVDVDLPEMKGYDAVSILKNIEPKTKVIVTTKKNSKELEAKVREQDIFFYFIKSFGKEELKLAINNVFGK